VREVEDHHQHEHHERRAREAAPVLAEECEEALSHGAVLYYIPAVSPSRPRWPVLAALLALGCELPPAPGTRPPSSEPRCPSLEEAVVGGWSTEGVGTEMRADGMLVLGTIEGAYRFVEPGRVITNVAGTYAEHAFGLADPMVLIDVEVDGRVRTWHRASAAPPNSEHCFAVGGAIVGRWSDGVVEERFDPDGHYQGPTGSGSWTQPGDGQLVLTVMDAYGRSTIGRYRIALSSADTLLSVIEDPDAGASAPPRPARTFRMR
jgi:hypothetical protein